MKKHFLFLILLLGGILSGFSQSVFDGQDNSAFYAGVSVGVPSGDLGETSSFTYGVVAGHSFDISERIGIAPELVYTHYVGKDVEIAGTTFEVDGFDFVGASARVDYALNSKFGIGGNVGYGKFLEENGDYENYFTVGARWNPVPGLVIRPEATFSDQGQVYSVRVYRTF